MKHDFIEIMCVVLLSVITLAAAATMTTFWVMSPPGMSFFLVNLSATIIMFLMFVFFWAIIIELWKD